MVIYILFVQRDSVRRDNYPRDAGGAAVRAGEHGAAREQPQDQLLGPGRRPVARAQAAAARLLRGGGGRAHRRHPGTGRHICNHNNY